MDTASVSPHREIVSLAALSALVVHQIFRRYDTYSLSVHASLILSPPTLVAFYAATKAGSALSVLDAWYLALAVFLPTLAASVVLYRVSPFHPLAQYPGPIMCKVSDFWIAYISLPGYKRRYIHALHDRYGDVVRVGPNNLSIRDPSVLTSLLGPSGLPKGPQFIGRFLSKDISSMIALQDTEAHLQRRRPWARGFTARGLREYEEIIGIRVNQLLSNLGNQKGETFLDEWFTYFTYDLMFGLSFGGGSHMLTSGDTDKRNFWDRLDGAQGLVTFLGHIPWLGVYLGHIPYFGRRMKTMLSQCTTLARKRLERGPTYHDIFYYLNSEDTPDAERVAPPIKQLVDDGILAILAGSDTVSNALSSVFSCLITHPDAYAKLQAEVDQYYPEGENPLDTKHHREMPYLNAVINEALRLFAPVPACTQRMEPLDGPGTRVGSLHIPPGTTFWIHAWSLHRDGRNFSPFPDDFWPERWIIAAADHSDDPRAQTRAQEKLAAMRAAKSLEYDTATFAHNDLAFVPFSIGPMNCVGKSLALQEMRMVICAIVQRFELKRREGWDLSQYEAANKDYFMMLRLRVPVSLKERKKSSG